MKALWILVPILLCSCSRGERDLMPLEVGNTWTYSLNTRDVGESLETLSIARRIALGEFVGYEITGDTGRTVVAWAGGVLLASELSGTRYEPALPLIPGEPESTWEGVVVVNGETTRASAKIARSKSTYELKNQARETVLVEHTIYIGEDTPMVIATHYADGIGILEQRQTLNGDLVLRIAFESGP